MASNNSKKKKTTASGETVASMEMESAEAVDKTSTTTTTRADDVVMKDATVNNEKEKKKKKKSKKKKKKKITKDDGVNPGGPMVEATDSTNATAASQGVRVGTESNIYNTRLPDVPIGYYYSEEAKAEGLKAEAHSRNSTDYVWWQ